jgi:hypothetical protein
MRKSLIRSSVFFALTGLSGCGAAAVDGSDTAAVTAAAATCAPINVTKLSGDPASLKTADLNGDGILDVIIGNTNDVVLTELLGLPAGGYAAPRSIPFGGADEAEEFDVGDVNGDRIPDLVIAKGYDFGTVQVLFGKGDGTFTLGAELEVAADGGAGPDTIRIADFNGDGKADFLSGNINESTVSVFLGDGHGNFGPPMLSTIDGAPGDLFAVDLDRDGKLDIVFHGGFALGKGDGTFKAEVAFAAGGYQSIAVGDFNKDGFVDVAGQTFHDSVVKNNVVRTGTAELLLGNGNGTFAAPKVVLSGNTNNLFVDHMIAAADFDHDGNLDLVNTVGGQLNFLFGAGNGTFARRQQLGGGQAVVAADAGSGRVFGITFFDDNLSTISCAP